MIKNFLPVLFILTCTVGEGSCLAASSLTEQDRISIASLQLPGAQKLLAAHFADYIRKESGRFGIDPNLAFEQSPTGIDDRAYRLQRLSELKQKREAQNLLIAEHQSSKQGLRSPLTRDEAIPLIAKQLGVPEDRTKELLAKYEPKHSKTIVETTYEPKIASMIYEPESDTGIEDEQYISIEDLFKDPVRKVNQKKVRKRRTDQAAQERKAQSEELRLKKEKEHNELRLQKEFRREELDHAKEERRMIKEFEKRSKEEAKAKKLNPPYLQNHDLEEEMVTERPGFGFTDVNPLEP